MATATNRLLAAGLWTARQAQEYLSCSRDHLRRLWIAGEIVKLGSGRGSRYPRQSVMDYVERLARQGGR